MSQRINRCSHCGCDEPILGIDGKLYCDNCGMCLEKLEGGSAMEESKIEIKEAKTYSIENLTYGHIETIYRALMVFEPKYPGGEEAQEELTKSLRRWV